MDIVEVAPETPVENQESINEEALVEEALLQMTLSAENVDDILENDDPPMTTIGWEEDPGDDPPDDPAEVEYGLDPDDPCLPPA